MVAPLIGLVAHVGKPGAAALVATLRDDFQRRGATIRLESKTAGLIGLPDGDSVRELGESCELLVVLGGDGTILQVVHDLGDNTRPILGINLGSLGFLTCVSSSAYARAVDAVMAGNFVLSQRTLLSVEIERAGRVIGRRTGLNDAVISRGEMSRLIRLQARIDGQVLTDYNADGLVISTPTGSTAYSLSAGGPILTPNSGVFVITPICPHVLTNRSVIVSDESKIAISPGSGQNSVFMTVDGQELLQVTCGDIIHIGKAARTLPLAMLPEMSFSEVLRQKLKWSGAAI